MNALGKVMKEEREGEIGRKSGLCEEQAMRILSNVDQVLKCRRNYVYLLMHALNMNYFLVVYFI